MKWSRWHVGSLFILMFWLGNSSYFSSRTSAQRTLLAHRGVYQYFDRTDVKNDSCTAILIEKPTHDFLENTLPSMDAAFVAGADIVELDIHPTTDGHFAVFHDWTLDCRTNGKGMTRSRSLSYLQSLDIGYGYTFDGGKTFPFRGRFVGAMPSLTQVLGAFPEKRFLINVKSGDANEGDLLANYLGQLSQVQRTKLMVYGKRSAPIARIREKLPDMVVMSKEILLGCLGQYLAIGWLGQVPKSCNNTLVFVPFRYRRLLWGWPNRFVERMAEHNAPVILVGPVESESISRGLDHIEELNLLDREYSGGIWTEMIEVIGPRVKAAGPPFAAH